MIVKNILKERIMLQPYDKYYKFRLMAMTTKENIN
jgi:hypothetical protein